MKSEAKSVSVLQPAQANHWLGRLHKLQSLVLLAYAVSLPISMTASWVLLTICAILFAVDFAAVFACTNLKRGEVRAQPCLSKLMRLSLPIAMVALAVFISGLANGGIGEGWRSVWSLKGMIPYYFASLWFARQPQLAPRAVGALLITGAIAGVWGTIQQVFNFHPFGYRYLQGTGFLGGPMAYAGQMQLFALLAVGLLISRGYGEIASSLFTGRQTAGSIAPADQHTSRFAFTVIVAANVCGVIFAGERSAWLGAVAGFLALVAMLSRRLLMRTVPVLALSLIVCWFTVPLIHTRLSASFDPQHDVSTRVRLQVWQRAMDEWRRSPVVGIGFLHFPHLDIPEAIVPGRSKDLNHAHSNYFQMLATTGVLGLAAYLWLLFASLLESRRLAGLGKKHNLPFATGTGAGLFAGLVSLAVAGLFEYNFGTAQVRMAQWFLLGLTGISTQSDPDTLPTDR